MNKKKRDKQTNNKLQSLVKQTPQNPASKRSIKMKTTKQNKAIQIQGNKITIYKANRTYRNGGEKSNHKKQANVRLKSTQKCSFQKTAKHERTASSHQWQLDQDCKSARRKLSLKNSHCVQQ